jgi:hypothetical protein
MRTRLSKRSSPVKRTPLNDRDALPNNPLRRNNNNTDLLLRI